MKKDTPKQNLYFLGFLIVILAVFSQLTRFQNDLTITYNGTNLSASGPQFLQPISLRIPDAQFTSVSASFRKSMGAEGGMSVFSISTNNATLISNNRFVFYLFGHDIFGTMMKGSYTGFINTFGDWSRDNFRSKEVLLYNDTLPLDFIITARILGRGTHFIYLKNYNTTVSVAFNDGRIDNTFSMCSSVGCNTVDREKISSNFIRITNFFIEATLLAAIIIFGFTFLERTFGEKNEK